MTPFYADEWLTILEGDCRVVLPSLPADSVDCVVTSPPYWGLRDYGTATWSGGDEACDHSTVGPGRAQRPAGGLTGGKAHVDAGTVKGGDCGRCGATRQDDQLGLERTPEEYVANMVAVFAEVRRVLKPSGTCWLNLGDSYAGNGKGDTYSGFNERYHGSTSQIDKQGQAGRSRVSAVQGAAVQRVSRSAPDYGDRLKPKDLVGIPWRVAFALQADGWYLRSDIIWSKPNPMPESVTDRPTKSHEYLFLLTKSSRYFFDADAVREPHVGPLHNPGNKTDNGRLTSSMGHFEEPDRVWGNAGGRNIRSVWTIATRPYPGAHFAVFPPELPERCIKAGSSERGVCPECGAPWERTTEKSRTFESGSGKAGNLPIGKNGANLQGGGETGDIRMGPVLHVETTGWEPTCQCADRDWERDYRAREAVGFDTPPEPELPMEKWATDPAVVLDPFAGSGTVGMVANRLSRRAILIDLNPEYLRQQMTRNAQTPLGLGAA